MLSNKLILNAFVKCKHLTKPLENIYILTFSFLTFKNKKFYTQKMLNKEIKYVTFGNVLNSWRHETLQISK